jgi:glutathione S-transferase
MRLRWSPSSPYTRKAVIVADEAGLLDKIELVLTHVLSPTAELLADNPLAKIPVLVLDDGTELFDSRVICEYLDAQSDKAMFPPAGMDRWRALKQQALADGVLDAGLLIRQEGRREEGKRSADWLAAQLGRMVRAVEAMSRDVASYPTKPTIGTIATAVALGYLDFRYPDVQWRAHERLAAWYETFSQRPSLAKSMLKEKK